MPRLDFNFSGWIRGAIITKASDGNGDEVDVSQMSPTELANKLNAGELFIALGDHLYESDDADIEMTDFEGSAHIWPDEV